MNRNALTPIAQPYAPDGRTRMLFHEALARMRT
jgi:hypothetical protein